MRYRNKRPPCLPILFALPAILGPVLSAASAAAGAVSAGLGAVGGVVGLTAGQTALLGASLISAGVSTGVSVAQGKAAQKTADAQVKQAELAAQHEQEQAVVRGTQERTSLGERQVALAQQAAQERGVIQASGLPVQSIRALVRGVEASRGRGDVAIRTNLEYAQQRQRAAVQASGLSLAGQKLTIQSSRPTNTAIGLGAGTTALGGIGSVSSQYDRYRAANAP